MKKISSAAKWFPYLMIIIYAAYTLPFIIEVITNQSDFSSLLFSIDSPKTPLLRTLLFALIQAILFCIVGLSISILLHSIKINSRKGRWLSILILPFLIGNVSTAFVFKLILLEFDFQLTSWVKYFILSLILIWQYGSLFIYLLWLNLQYISKDIYVYASISKFSTLEKIRDIILPRQKNLLLLIFTIGFIFSLFEDFKFQFLFKASRGTNTEFINSWIRRTYYEGILSNPDMAFQDMSSVALLTFLLALTILITLLVVFNKSLEKTKKFKNIKFKIPINNTIIVNSFFSFSILFVLTPIIVVIPSLIEYNFTSLLELLPTISITIVAALISSFCSIFFSIHCRLIWDKVFDSMKTKSLMAIVINLFLLIIPPILLLILGFKWMKIVGYSSNIALILAWLLGQILFISPILIVFAIVIHFRVDKNKLEYIKVHNLPFSQTLLDVFWQPFKGDYLLIIILAFTTIWNESTINNILSDRVPSFVTELNKTIIGRSADYSSGVTYLLFSIFIALVCILIWDKLVSKISKNFNK